ncbi:MAG: sigma-54 dependent transcriptional regulator [Congregibacter sp.]|nr:sigma-54 dependent transcriptional regulator [Congregibacter sp.]
MTQSPVCLIVDSDKQHAAALASLCSRKGYRCHTRHIAEGDDASADLFTEVHSDEVDIAFLDTALGLPLLSKLTDDALAGAEIFAMAQTDDSRFAQACVRTGISHYFCKPFSEINLSAMLDDILEELSSPPVSDASADPKVALDQFGLMRGSSKSMRKLFRLLRKIGPTQTTALVIGESGTGKELVAETLHALSDRADGPYLTLNCSALAENLIESELFGHEKGSFSGAHKRHSGFFERAHGGTLFLDEITEMQPDLQAKLLRALESGEIRRVGAVEPLTVDVRVLAATNRDPLLAVEEGQLREDLYYRLAHISVHVPPLRRRMGDIKGLAQFFLMQLNEQHKTALTISDAALDTLSRYEWPGNVRQLRHAVERAYIVSEGEIGEDGFVFDEEPSDYVPSEHAIPIAIGESLAECERKIIVANLEHNGGDKKVTASVLGISLKTLYNRLRDYEAADDAQPH